MRIVTKMKQMKPDQLRRNCLTIRFQDAEHQAVRDEAWRRKMTASGWIRDLVMEKLKQKGAKL